MSIYNRQTVQYIEEWFGKDGVSAIITAEKAINAYDKNIHLLFRLNQLNFLLLHSQNTKKEVIEKVLNEHKFTCWRPVIVDKTSEEKNLILELQPTDEMAKLFHTADELIASILPPNTQVQIQSNDDFSQKFKKFLGLPNSTCLTIKKQS
jgi:hypothetical protein